MAAVQFTGIENVIKAFSNREVKAWSVWIGKQFLFSCVGANETEAAADLETLLNSLEKSAHVYTLKVYEDIGKKERITEKTPAHGSFNFKLLQYDGSSGNNMPEWMREIKDENKALKLQNETLMQELEESDDDEPPKDIIGTITELIVTDPAKIPVIAQSIYAIIKMFTGQTTQTGQPFAQPAPVAISGVTENSLQSVIDELKQYDPRLTEHLQKLVLIAKNDPAGFKSLLGILDNMN